MNDEATVEKVEEPSEVQPTAVLAQVGVMPDGNLQVAVAQEVTERVAFCLEVSRQFLLLAGQQYAAEKTKKGPEIVVAPPGMRVQ
jgi:predicted transcriptional regulator